jgi:hypothetical protein
MNGRVFYHATAHPWLPVIDWFPSTIRFPQADFSILIWAVGVKIVSSIAMIRAQIGLERDSIKIAIRACSVGTPWLISLLRGTVSPASAQSAKPTSLPARTRGKLPFARHCACHERDAVGSESGPDLTRSHQTLR